MAPGARASRRHGCAAGWQANMPPDKHYATPRDLPKPPRPHGRAKIQQPAFRAPRLRQARRRPPRGPGTQSPQKGRGPGGAAPEADQPAAQFSAPAQAPACPERPAAQTPFPEQICRTPRPPGRLCDKLLVNGRSRYLARLAATHRDARIQPMAWGNAGIRPACGRDARAPRRAQTNNLSYTRAPLLTTRPRSPQLPPILANRPGLRSSVGQSAAFIMLKSSVRARPQLPTGRRQLGAATVSPTRRAGRLRPSSASRRHAIRRS